MVTDEQVEKVCDDICKMLEPVVKHSGRTMCGDDTIDWREHNRKVDFAIEALERTKIYPTYIVATKYKDTTCGFNNRIAAEKYAAGLIDEYCIHEIL